MESLKARDEPQRLAHERVVAPPPRRSFPAVWRGWHPVARTIVVLFIAAVVGYGALVVTNEFLRGSRVDTWAGPDVSVRSGRVLTGCPEVEGLGSEAFPAWIRYRDAVYAWTGRLSPVGMGWQYGETPYIESGFRLGSIRLLLEEQPAEAAPAWVLLLQEPAAAARLYDLRDCA